MVIRCGACPRLQHRSRPLRCQIQVVGAVGNELKVFKVGGLILGELNTEQEDVTDGNGGFK
jgi:hypothetical protein